MLTRVKSLSCIICRPAYQRVQDIIWLLWCAEMLWQLADVCALKSTVIYAMHQIWIRDNKNLTENHMEAEKNIRIFLILPDDKTVYCDFLRKKRDRWAHLYVQPSQRSPQELSHQVSSL